MLGLSVSDMRGSLKTLFEKEFKGTVDDVISNNTYPLNIDAETLCEMVVSAIWQSKEMIEFKSRVLTFSKEALKNDSLNSGEELVVGRTCVSSDTGNNVFSCDDVNSWNKTPLLSSYFLSSNLSQCSQRIHALELLLRAPVDEVVFSTAWPQLHQELCEGLYDDNIVVFYLVLRIHARLLSTSAATSVKEGFLSLIEGLTLYYLSRKTIQMLPTTQGGIHLDNNVHKKMILITKCAIEGIYELPRIWVRFGEKCVQEILENVIDLIAMHTHIRRSFSNEIHGTILYPFHLISVLDPEARWCKVVSHAAFGRTLFNKLIAKSNSLLQFVVEEIILWLDCQIKQSHGVMFVYETYVSGNVSGTMITLTVFMHCLSLLKVFIGSDRAYSAFPIQCTLEQDPITVYGLALRILSFLNVHMSRSVVVYSQRVLELVEETVTGLILCKGTRILYGRSSQLARLLMEALCVNETLSLPHRHNISILNKIAEVDYGIGWILGRPEKKNRENYFRSISGARQTHPSSAPASRKESGHVNQSPCVAVMIVDCTVAALKQRHCSAAAEVLCQLLSLCGKLFGTIDGFIVLESYENQLIQEAGGLYIHLSDSYFRNDGLTYSDNLQTVGSFLEQFFMRIAMTPLGFVSVSKVDGLVTRLIGSHLQLPVRAWNTPQFMHLIELTVLLSDSALKNYRRMLISEFLTELWSSLDETRFISMEEQARQVTVRVFLSRLLSVCSSPDVVSELLTDTSSDGTSDSSERTLVDEHVPEPLSLGALFRNGLEQTYPLHVNYVCFCSLYALSQNIDVSVVLQEKLSLQEHLVHLQQENSFTFPSIRDRDLSAGNSDSQPSPRRDLMNIYNENSLLRGHILYILYQVRDCCAHDNRKSISSWNVVSPRAQLRTARLRMQTDLQRFLQDTRLGLHDNMWLTHARRAYRMSCQSDMKVCVLLDLLEQVVRCQSSPPTMLQTWPAGAVSHARTEYFLQAIQLVVRYGCQQRVLNSHMSAQYEEQLALLLDQAYIISSRSRKDSYFDWFVASVFLMCSGNIDRSRSVLQKVAMLHIGPLIWPCFSEAPWQKTAIMSHQLQGLIAEHLPNEHNILEAEGIPWWHTMIRLTHQSFISAFPLSQLPHIVAFCALHSSDYILYLRTAMLTPLKSRKFNIVFEPTRCLLTELPTDGFFISNFIPFIDRLAKLNRTATGRDKFVTSTL